MQKLKFIFAGNRSFVLEELLSRNLNVIKIYVVPNSYLQKYCESKKIAFEIIQNKKHLVEDLGSIDFDVLVSNGLPVILPISKIRGASSKKFINVHPSFLPDLRGADPIPAAILFQKNSGATCHFMDETIDTGPIISQIRISMNDKLDANLLYNISFIVEREVFAQALDSNFDTSQAQSTNDSNIYYTFQNEDLQINFNEESSLIVSRIKAFNTPSKGAFFIFRENKIIVWDAEKFDDDLLFSTCKSKQVGEIIFIFKHNLIVKTRNSFVNLKEIEKINLFTVGQNLIYNE
jgi:methionyl-tRNA formyltransferase